MDSRAGLEGAREDEPLARTTICLPDFVKKAVSHGGDDGFTNILRRYFDPHESDASERLARLKDKLREASTYDFWGMLMVEMCDIVGAQCGFVAKRILVDDQNTAVEMPPLGEPGSCLLGVAFYINNGSDVESLQRDYTYHAYCSPCAHMKHEKVFLIPERMQEFVPNSPNSFPWDQSDAFIGVPLFHKGKSFAHFGMIWSLEGASKRKLSWSFIEMFMHSLEDMILQRILEGRGFAKEPATSRPVPARIIPLDAITASSQSLKPYARSLSHELRTPMQGVVGMLDIMHSTVMDAMETQTSKHAKAIFEELKANIETVQESSKRAVEAADNVVHAYDLNMQMPETPLVTHGDTGSDNSSVAPETREKLRPDIVIEGSGISLDPMHRKRSRSEELDFHPGPPLKRLTTMAEYEPHWVHSRLASQTNGPAVDTWGSGDGNFEEDRGRTRSVEAQAERNSRNNSSCTRTPTGSPPLPSQTSQNVVIRDLIRAIVHDTLRVIHPVFKVSTPTECGEKVELVKEGPRGQKEKLIIYSETDPDVPGIITAEEQYLQFALQKVIHNAIKFTENGNVKTTVKLSRNGQLIDIRVTDTGCGLTEESKAHLFKPHFQEDASISRAKDGLGLSLFNAKAHVRKYLGGDVTLERSATEGSLKGSEFLIRIPAFASWDGSGPNTPRVSTPVPSSHSGSRPSSPKSTAGKPATSAPPPTSAPIPRRQSLPKVQSPMPAKGTKILAFNRNLAKVVPLTFLIAEDNAINRQILVNYLKKLGYATENIIQAYDGVEAVHQYKASLSRPANKRVNAVLMDLWMPNMDGYEAAEEILKMASDKGETLAVMAVTADITSDSLERAKEIGMKGFISKPYKVLDIEHLILEHFRSTQ